MPPIIVTTGWPTGNSPPGQSATTPAASIPRTRGNVTPDARPWRVCNSDRFTPNALTSISTQPAVGIGTGSSRIVRASGGPGASRTIARMLSVIQDLLSVIHRKPLLTRPQTGDIVDVSSKLVCDQERSMSQIHEDRVIEGIALPEPGEWQLDPVHT